MKFILKEELLNNRVENILTVNIILSGELKSFIDSDEAQDIIREDIYHSQSSEIIEDVGKVLIKYLPETLPAGMTVDMDYIDGELTSWHGDNNFEIEGIIYLSVDADRLLTEEELDRIKQKLESKIEPSWHERNTGVQIPFYYEYISSYSPAVLDAPAEDCHPEEFSTTETSGDFSVYIDAISVELGE